MSDAIDKAIAALKAKYDLKPSPVVGCDCGDCKECNTPVPDWGAMVELTLEEEFP